MGKKLSENSDRKNDQRVVRKLRVLEIAVVLGALYFIWLKCTGIAVPCIVRKVTGWRCPGCGITTLFYCALQLRIKDAFWANPFLFVTMPFLLYEAVREGILGPTHSKWNDAVLIGYLVLLLAFGVVRNLIGV